MTKIRQAAVAGMFYPANPMELRHLIKDFLEEANSHLPNPKAIIAPHAGYIYSGPIAASAFACLHQVKDQIKQVVLLGPSHRYFFQGLGASSMDYFETPLGQIKLDQKAIQKILSLPQVSMADEAHQSEHSLEVQLPFLQVVLSDFLLVPLVISDASVEQIAEVITLLWNGPETLIVISSDLSHYLDYESAKKIDQKTADAIVSLKQENISSDQACGSDGIKGLIQVAKEKNLRVSLIDLRNSGDTAGTKDQVVGYGAFHFSNMR